MRETHDTVILCIGCECGFRLPTTRPANIGVSGFPKEDRLRGSQGFFISMWMFPRFRR